MACWPAFSRRTSAPLTLLMAPFPLGSPLTLGSVPAPSPVSLSSPPAPS